MGTAGVRVSRRGGKSHSARRTRTYYPKVAVAPVTDSLKWSPLLVQKQLVWWFQDLMGILLLVLTRLGTAIPLWGEYCCKCVYWVVDCHGRWQGPWVLGASWDCCTLHPIYFWWKLGPFLYLLFNGPTPQCSRLYWLFGVHCDLFVLGIVYRPRARSWALAHHLVGAQHNT